MITVVIPTFNEVDNLEAVVDRTCTALWGRPFRVLIVDDDSPDGTGVLADAIAAGSENVSVLHRPAKQGLGPAYLAGFAEALRDGADLIVEMDADLSHDPADLPRLIDAAKDADLVIGSRYVPGGATVGWAPHRRLLSRLGGRYAALVLGLRVADPTSGLRCFTRAALGAIGPEVASHGYGFQIEMAYLAARRGLRIAEVPIVFRERERGRSKMHWGIALEALIRVPLIRLSVTLSRSASITSSTPPPTSTARPSA